MSAICTGSPVEITIVPLAGPLVFVLERRKGLQVQQTPLGRPDEFDLHDVSLGHAGGLEVSFVDPQREAIPPSSNFGEHVRRHIMYLHPPFNLCGGGPNVTPEPARDGLPYVAACVAGKIHAEAPEACGLPGCKGISPLRRRRRSMAGARHEHFRFLGDVVPRLVGERLYAGGPCAPRLAAPTLWHHPDFLKLWIGQSVSQFGNQFTGLALQLFAVRVLLATPGQMGLLGALGTLPFLLFGLLVGVWVDRHRRRPILIAGDFGRGLVVASIAVLTLLSLARMEYLYLLGFATGILTVFFDVSYQAYLPALVPRDQIVEGNSKLEATNTTAQVSGPVLAGFVIRALGYAAAMAFDGVSFFFSAGLMVRIRKPETVPKASERRSVPKEIREGLRVVFGDRRLWSIAGCTGTSNLFSSALFALFVLYAVRNLGLDEVGLGIIGGLGSIGGILGAVTANRVARRLGVGRAILLGLLVGSASSFWIVFATPGVAFAFLTAMGFAGALGTLWYNINQVSLRQALVSLRLQGRLNATMRFLVWGTLPVGSLLGGALGEALGLYPAIVIAAFGGLLAIPWILFSPVRKLATIPPPTEE